MGMPSSFIVDVLKSVAQNVWEHVSIGSDSLALGSILVTCAEN